MEARVFQMLVNNWQLYDNFSAIDMGWSFIFFTKFNKAPSLQISYRVKTSMPRAW